jgi:16S rRNA processing protein RimM
MELKEVGYFSKTHGVKGNLVLKADLEFYFEEVKAFFVETAGSKAPYFVAEIKESNIGLVVVLEDVDDVNKAKALLKKKVFIDASLVAEEEDVTNWLGYELIDKHFGSLGTIHEVDDSGHQLLVSILFREKEVILPLVEEFIIKIDEKKKTIWFNAPEGLIDIYL